jgi:hypothetical protein
MWSSANEGFSTRDYLILPMDLVSRRLISSLDGSEATGGSPGWSALAGGRRRTANRLACMMETRRFVHGVEKQDGFTALYQVHR